jgi:hypothetical protein
MRTQYRPASHRPASKSAPGGSEKKPSTLMDTTGSRSHFELKYCAELLTLKVIRPHEGRCLLQAIICVDEATSSYQEAA